MKVYICYVTKFRNNGIGKLMSLMYKRTLAVFNDIDKAIEYNREHGKIRVPGKSGPYVDLNTGEKRSGMQYEERDPFHIVVTYGTTGNELMYTIEEFKVQ